MLYPKNQHPFDKPLFQNPTSEYRGTPFWAWNCKMTEQVISETLTTLSQMGMGGAHLHSRTGMNTPYLSPEFMRLVQYTDKECKNRDMLCWLYDEDRWPSGFGGGFVTQDDAYRARFLLFSPVPLADGEMSVQHLTSHAGAVRSGRHTLLGHYAITLLNGYLEDYRLLSENEQPKPGEHEWYAYLEISGNNPWFNNQAYVNALDKKAMQRFIEVTHETYFKAVGDEFGKSIPAIFTDEPQFSRKQSLKFAEDRAEISLPFTGDLEETFKKTYGESLIAHLPELFWELPDNRISQIRYQYHDHIAERFAQAFADTVGKWCEDHGIALTGHMMEEPTLLSQTAALGDAMRSLRSFGIPGIDMLCDQVELSTAKQAQSAAHQYGREGVLSELYGVTNWAFDFRGHKRQGDWQAALGVTVRVHHLTWSSMAGEAKRDYPASIGVQSPWHPSYRYIEDYFARVNSVLTRGKPFVKVGVIHPVESYWLHWGPQEQTGAIRDALEQRFEQLNKWLIHGLIDFDFIAESLLPELVKVPQKDGTLSVGAMDYDVVVIPACETLRGTTITALEAFQKRGGKIIFAGKWPTLEDARPSMRACALAELCTNVAYEQMDLLKALEPHRLIEVRDQSGYHAKNLAHQFREEEGQRHLFITHVNKEKNLDLPRRDDLSIRLKGEWEVTLLDAMTGEIKQLPVEHRTGDTFVSYTLFDHDTLLVTLSPRQADAPQIAPQTAATELKNLVELPARVPVTLEEPNVLILDMAEYKFDDGEWQPTEEILRIDNKFRALLNLPKRTEAFAQPWVYGEPTKAEHKLSLRFAVSSEVDVPAPKLALEDAAEMEIWLNGELQRSEPGGIYVDRAIQTVQLRALKQGKNELVIKMSYASWRNVECMYLLGDFGVQVRGREAVIIEPIRTLAFSDITGQGMPFYGGNYTYHLDVEIPGGDVLVRTPKFRCPAIKISVDGEEKGLIALAPYELRVTGLSAGKHQIDVTVFGNRSNTFGALHNCDEVNHWFGPDAWRSTGARWSYEYQLDRTGLLRAPDVMY